MVILELLAPRNINKMGDLNFQKIFEELKKVQANAVSRTKYAQLQTEVKRLEAGLKDAKNQLSIFKSLNQMLEFRLNAVNEKLKQYQAAEKISIQTPIEMRLMRLANAPGSNSSKNLTSNTFKNALYATSAGIKRDCSPARNRKRKRPNNRNSARSL